MVAMSILAGRRTDMTKLIGLFFCDCANSPKKYLQFFNRDTSEKTSLEKTGSIG